MCVHPNFKHRHTLSEREAPSAEDGGRLFSPLPPFCPTDASAETRNLPDTPRFGDKVGALLDVLGLLFCDHRGSGEEQNAGVLSAESCF